MAELVPTERFLVFLPPFPAVAVDDDNGRVYVAFHDGRAAEEPEAGADVLLWASPDGGANWDEGMRVTDTPRGDGTRQYLPQLDICPSSTWPPPGGSTRFITTAATIPTTS